MMKAPMPWRGTGADVETKSADAQHSARDDRPQPDADKKQMFSPVPVRAFGDRRLAASHWRVLSAIAWHDRFNKNGSGCYASHKTIAQESRIDYTNLSKCVADLADWGYIVVGVHPLGRRLRTYTVNYDETTSTTERSSNRASGTKNRPSAIVGQSTNYDAATDAVADDDATVGETTNHSAEIVGAVLETSEPGQQLASDNIFPEGDLKNSSEEGDVTVAGDVQGKRQAESRLHEERKAEAGRQLVKRLGNTVQAWEMILELPTHTIDSMLDDEMDGTMTDDKAWSIADPDGKHRG